jgi:hypothetical protein
VSESRFSLATHRLSSVGPYDDIYTLDGGSTDGTLEYYQGKDVKIIGQNRAGRGSAFLQAFHQIDVDAFIFFRLISNVLTDRGSEFMKDFDFLLKTQQTTHWHTYSRTPKMNAHDERFNRTIQDEFIDYNFENLLYISDFNNKLFDYLL